MQSTKLASELKLVLLQPGAQQYDIIFLITAFEAPTLSVTSEENGGCVNMMNG